MPSTLTATTDATWSSRAVTTAKLALADGWLYWGDREGHRVSRARIDRRDRQDLVVNPAGIGNQCVGVAVDGDYFY